MNQAETISGARVELRKYPNRRYYDATHSRHVTLEEIRTLICDGADIRATDSKTGEDITAKVLTQIILEQDPPKLGFFPVELLHQLIRANSPLIRDFVDKYFNHALRAFLESQRQFEQYLRQALGLKSALHANAQGVELWDELAQRVNSGFEELREKAHRADSAAPAGLAPAERRIGWTRR